MKRLTKRKQPLFCTLPEAADLLGIHRATAYRQAKRDGAIAGVPVVRVTDTKVVVSRAAIERLAEPGDR